MKRKVFGAASLGITVIALGMSAPASAQDLDVNLSCGQSVQECVTIVGDAVQKVVNDTMDTACDIIFRDCGSLLP